MSCQIVLRARPPRSPARRRLALALVTAFVASGLVHVAMPAAAAPADHARGGGGGHGTSDSGDTCHPKKGCPEPTGTSEDATAPTVSISEPASGTVVEEIVTMSGTAQDDVGVDRVDVAVDDGTFSVADGVANWSATLETSGWAPGDHLLRARVTDTSGNTHETTVTVSVAADDVIAPTVTIDRPADEVDVAGTVRVSGSASDDRSVSEVAVLVDGALTTVADGTATWEAEVDTSAWTVGEHEITVRAQDPSGNVGTDTVLVVVSDGPEVTETFSNGDLTWTRERLEHPSFTGEDLTALQYGRMARHGGVNGVLYRDTWTGHRGVHLRDLTSGDSQFVELAAESHGWAAARVAMSSDRDLWVLGGLGSDITLRRFVLGATGTSGLSTTASLADEIALPATDARVGDLLALDSGAVVAVWRDLTANEYRIAYATPATGLVEVEAVAFMPTGSSNQVAAQHPADGAVWVFSNADSWSSIGALRLREDASGLDLEYAEGNFIGSQHGDFDADPEHPKLAVASDDATGQLVLAYQSADRWRYSTSPWVVGSTVALARVSEHGMLTFEASPVRAERIAWLGLTISDGATWLAYRPVDEATLTYANIHVVRGGGSSWSQPADLGATVGTQDPVLHDPASRTFALQLATGGLHRFEFASSLS